MIFTPHLLLLGYSNHGRYYGRSMWHGEGKREIYTSVCWGNM